MLVVFFATVSLLLAGIGLYGVLKYSVLQRRREIGIRIAIGAKPREITRLVTGGMFALVAVGSAAGLILGMASSRYIESLFFQVKATDANMLALPPVVVIFTAILAALLAVLRALHTDPTEILRAERGSGNAGFVRPN